MIVEPLQLSGKIRDNKEKQSKDPGFVSKPGQKSYYGYGVAVAQQ